MGLSRRTFLGTVVAGSAVLAGCTSDSSPSDDRMDDPTVRVRSHPGLGDVLVGSEGMTLYMFDQDTQGEGASTCSGGCTDNWPPLTVDDDPVAGSGVAADISTFEREDGSTQVAANGWPLYYFTPDEAPGDVNGQGVNDAWWVLRSDGNPVRSSGSTESGTSAPTETDSRY